jgi:hypothetical protein
MDNRLPADGGTAATPSVAALFRRFSGHRTAVVFRGGAVAASGLNDD